MAYRKIYIAVDCSSDEEARQVQKIAEDMSAIFALSGKDMVSLYPSVENNASRIKSTIKTISRDGMKGLGKVITGLMTNFRRS
jgi:hypothetical protein